MQGISSAGSRSWLWLQRFRRSGGGSEELPVKRIIKNLEWKLKHEPTEEDRFAYARACSYAFAFPEELYHTHPHHPTTMNADGKGKAKPDATGRHYLQESIRTYEALVGLQRGNAQYWLGLGYTLELAAKESMYMPNIKVRGKVLWNSTRYLEASLEAYRECYRIDVADGLGETYGEGELSWLAKESGERIIDIITAQYAGYFKIGERAEIEETIRKSKARRRGPVTPILFPIDRPRPLGDLVDLKAKTSFDLEGAGRGQTWPWITSRAAWLVWDPRESGKITSGRQLFGSGTWWMFYPNGYAALASLDDDRDGWLQGKELQGVAVWHDRDGDAVSDAGEVVPVETWGVLAIQASYDRATDSALEAERGLILKGGRTFPTYDWYPRGRGIAP